MPDPYSPLVESALVFAARAHRHQVRKATDVPYIVHPVGVMLILQQAGEADPEVLAAGVLHDTLEDAGVSTDTLVRQFGQRVADIVVGCSEPDHATAAWEVRKRHTIAYLRSAPREIQLVAAADKLHNLWSMSADYAELGDRLWRRFSRGRPELEWYYRSVAGSLSAGEVRAHPIVRQLNELVVSFFG